ncbi:restriction endonuclease subunit S [Acinetobacter lwoffii]|uniref:restriction endonuclease subunit S n=1 Tax=Acinetobacter lwoffii TaxID=28090 RepID=UPI0021CD70D7|nr:restriction endonuclease subunit S [Acinetobacter lwoffii]MCU4451065.1 restriction endonuclease subunit S [Acinetobacter lwoffii]
MAKYQKYAEYKDSGVEWLGEIPGHWDSKPLKYLCTYNDEVLSETTYKEAEIQYIDIGSVSAVDGISHIETMIFKDAPSRARRIVKDGDVIVSTVRTYLEAIAPIDNPPENLIVSTGFAVIRPNQYLYKGFAAYCLRAKGFIKEVVARSVGVSYPAINSSELVNITIPSVEYSEQVKIANFLEYETSKIDSLIAKQKKLIELLKEKRQAVISHAVTKGLNPHVTMKDSGVEWLGQVPEHWKCIKIKHITTTFEQGWSPQCDSRPAESHEYGVLKVGCVNGGSFRSSENKALPPELEPRLQYLIQKDDLLISRANTKELVGSASVVNGDYPNLILCDKLYRLRFSKNVLPEMVSLYLSIGAVRKQIELGATGASHSMQNIGQDTIKELYYLLPPYEEALNILESIKQSNQKFDELTKKAESAIQLMQERRTALISSAVTGKIDVRNWQYPNEAKTELSA